MQPSTIFKSDRFRLFDIGSLSWRPVEFVLLLVIEIHGVVTVLVKKVILEIPPTDLNPPVSHLSVIVVSVLAPLQLRDNLLSTPEIDM